MDVFDEKHYKICRIFFILLGLWPYQESFSRFLPKICLFVIFVSFSLTQVFLVCRTKFTFELVVRFLTITTTAMIYTLKYLIFAMNPEKTRDLIERMKDNWRTVEIQVELEILERHVKHGKLYILAFTSMLLFTATAFALYPALPLVLDIILPLNETRPREFMIIADYLVDTQEHFFPIFVHTSMCTLAGMSAAVGSDIMYMTYLQHACGMFDLTGHRLDQAYDPSTSADPRTAYNNLVESIKWHKKTIEFVDITNSMFSLSYLLQTILTVTAMTLIFYQLSRVLGHWDEMMIDIVFINGAFIHAFCNVYPAQKLIDCSAAIFHKAYHTKWYSAPTSMQKMLLLIMQKSMSPCTIVVGKFYHLSYEMFGSALHASLSYFTVLCSL